MPLLSPKTLAEVKDYAVEWEDELGAGDSIQSVSATADPATLQVVDTQITGTRTLMRLSGGSVGSYVVTVQITTAGGEVLEAAVPIEVMEAAAVEGLTL
jgi:hypothetical protein